MTGLKRSRRPYDKLSSKITLMVIKYWWVSSCTYVVIFSYSTWDWLKKIRVIDKQRISEDIWLSILLNFKTMRKTEDMLEWPVEAMKLSNLWRHKKYIKISLLGCAMWLGAEVPITFWRKFLCNHGTSIPNYMTYSRRPQSYYLQLLQHSTSLKDKLYSVLGSFIFISMLVLAFKNDKTHSVHII